MQDTLPREAAVGKCVEFIFPAGFARVALYITHLETYSISGLDLISGRNVSMRIKSSSAVYGDHNWAATDIHILSNSEIRLLLNERPSMLEVKAKEHASMSSELLARAEMYRRRIPEILTSLAQSTAA